MPAAPAVTEPTATAPEAQTSTTVDLASALNRNAIEFASGSTRIAADSDDALMRVAEAIKGAPAGTVVEIGGHTDSMGDDAANRALSQHRADAVRARLIELGVAADSLRSKGYGEDKPIADNGTPEGRAKNRRIEFAVAE